MNWGYPNRRSASMFRKMGWRTVGVIRPLSFYFRADADARRERFADGRVAAALLPFAVRGSKRRRKALRRRAGEGWEARPLDEFPEEVGELSRQVEPRFALMVRRDRAFCQWRFLEAPSRAHRPFGIFRDGRLAGYVVVQPPLDGSPVGWVVDLLAPESWAVAAALETALGELEGAGARVARATAVDGSWWSETLAHAGFLAPKPDNHLFVYTYALLESHPVLDAASDASEWYLCDADRDDDPIG